MVQFIRYPQENLQGTLKDILVFRHVSLVQSLLNRVNYYDVVAEMLSEQSITEYRWYPNEILALVCMKAYLG